jgi:cytochrome c1
MKKIFSLLFLCTLAGCTSADSKPTPNNPIDFTPIQTTDLADFASCLATRGELFYSETCPHCHDQMEMFGEAVNNLAKHDCLNERNLCSQKQITGVPAWIFEDGSKLLGKQSFEKLSEQSGCLLPDSLRTAAL